MTTKQKIPQAFIDDLLAKADIVEWIAERVKIKRSGTNWYGNCPFHQENTPSFSVSQTKQFYYCFGCKASGNIVQFIMDYHHYSFPETIELMANQLGLTMPTELIIAQSNHSSADYDKLAQIAQCYHQQLLKSPPAMQYVTQRGLSIDTIKQFQIGYAPDQWRFILHQFSQNQQTQQQLETLGMVISKKDNCYDRFRNRIMFPIQNIKGQVIAFGGRVTDNSTPKYLNSPETPIYHKSEELFGLHHVRKQSGKISKILVVEGYMDVIALANAGVHYAVATLGTAITPNHLKKLLRQCEHLIFCFDGDNAGHSAAWKALTTALPHAHDGTHIMFSFLPEGEDPDSYINRHDKTTFEHFIQQGTPLSDYFFEKLCQQNTPHSLDQKAALAKKATQHINTMPDGIFKTLLLKRLSETITLPVATLAPPPPLLSSPPSTHNNNNNNQHHSPIQQAITLLVHFPSIAQHVTPMPLENHDAPGITLLHALIALLQQNPSISHTGTLLQHIDAPKWHKQLSQLASTDIFTQEHEALATFNALITQHKKRQTTKAIQQLIGQASLGTLTPKDKQRLQKLIKQQKDGK
jgi:DNA primase